MVVMRPALLALLLTLALHGAAASSHDVTAAGGSVEAAPAPPIAPEPSDDTATPVAEPLPAAGAPASAPPSPAPPPVDAARAGGPLPAAAVPEVWATIIGIDRYAGLAPDLTAAVDDATAMIAALEHLGVDASHRSVHLDGDATAAGVRAGVRWLVDHAGPEDTAVVFYAGHARLQGATQVVVGSDGTTVSDVELAELLAPLRAKQSWIVMAACYGGGFSELLAPGRILTAASPGDQLAFENLDLDASYLGHYLIGQALHGGRADASVQDAFTWSQTQLTAAFPNRPLVQEDWLGRPLDLRNPAA